MRSFIKIVITICLLFSLTACDLTTKNNTITTPTPAPTATPEPTPSPEPEATPTPNPVYVDVPEGVLLNYLNYTIHKVSDDPLFKANGEVNTDVLESLIKIINDPKLEPLLREPKATWSSGLSYNGISYIETTAEDFSSFVVPNPSSMSSSGAVVIKLFETIPGSTGVHNGHLTEFTSQWWQLVYRATGYTEDVLTLWMMQPYRVTPFNGTRYDEWANNASDRFVDRLRAEGDNVWSGIQQGSVNTVLSDERISLGLPPCNEYFFEGNYNASIARSNLLRDTDFIIDRFNINSYLVVPSDLPGLWQSSVYQTGTNMNHEYFVTGRFFTTGAGRRTVGSEDEIDGLGATGLIWGDLRPFSLINGMDGFSVGPYSSNWPNTSVESTYDDLFWLPSDFEVRTMGFDKDSARSFTLLRDADNRTTALRANREVAVVEIDEDEDEETEDSEDIEEIEDITEDEDLPDTGRSGLWRLNGFDRAFDRDALGMPRGWITEQVWLRTQDSLGIGSVNVVTNRGSRYAYGVNQLAGMRPAVHLSITELLKEIE